MKMTCQQLLLESVDRGSVFLAHAIYIGIQHGYFKANDSTDKINLDIIPKEFVIEAATANRLNIKVVQLFALRRPFENEYAYYLAYDEQSAVQKHWELFGEKVKKVFNQTNKIHTSIVGLDEPIRKAKTFFEHKRKAKFPHFCGLIESKAQKTG